MDTFLIVPQPTQFQPLWIKFLDSFLSELFYAARSTHFIYISDCPCELFCPQGCIDCNNPVCQEVVTTTTTTTTTTTVAITTSVSSTTTSTAPVTTTTTPSMPWTTNSTLSYTVLVLSTYRSSNKPMTVDFNGKNHSDFHFKSIFIFDIKEMLTMIWFLNMVKVQMHMEVVELLWWEKCGILVVIIVLRDKYESFLFTEFE